MTNDKREQARPNTEDFARVKQWLIDEGLNCHPDELCDDCTCKNCNEDRVSISIQTILMYAEAALLREASADSAQDVNDAELSAWEALCEKAVDGPWKVQRYSNYEGWAVYSDTYGCVAERWEADAESNARPDRAQYFDAHSKLIAASRTALPRLIAALRAARQREQTAVGLLRRGNRYDSRT